MPDFEAPQGVRLVSHERFAGTIGHEEVHYIAPGWWVSLFGFWSILFNLLYAWRLLWHTKRNDGLILNGGYGLWMFIGLLNRFVTLRRRRSTLTAAEAIGPVHGTVSDIPAFLAGLDVAVLCSHSEGSPNAIMECMAAGVPTIATDVGGNGELVEHEQTGLLTPPNRKEGLATAIDRLLPDPPLAARLGAAARQRAFAEFSAETQARRYEDFYHELVRSRTRAK